MNSQKKRCRVLTTGGPGYIGSHITHLLKQSGYHLIFFNDLSTGNAWAIRNTPLIQENILDEAHLQQTLEANKIQTVIHSAAKNNVPESFQQPANYTAERDYIHVQDLADLHLQAMSYLKHDTRSTLLNTGYGQSHSALKFIHAFDKVSQKSLAYRYVSRRHGDPSPLISDVALLQKTIDWKPQYRSLEAMIGSSYAWETSSTRKSLI